MDTIKSSEPDVFFWIAHAGVKKGHVSPLSLLMRACTIQKNTSGSHETGPTSLSVVPRCP